ncbi:40S ribosomal protein mrp10 [Nothophoma quercina]|uniref:40S ribosomal protein mrp10 n=1 Tax=Nothophoma quercina TaxID=749835 RepID=A0ABR3RJP6_9PLEO
MVPKPQGQAVQSVTHRPLPPLPKLRVRRPNKPETNPCLGAMSSRDKNQKKNNINYHLSRMYPKIIGPHKRD